MVIAVDRPIADAHTLRKRSMYMSRIAGIARYFRDEKTAPRFLLFLKNRGRSSSLDEPAKSSFGTEMLVFVLFVFVILAIVSLVLRTFIYR